MNVKITVKNNSLKAVCGRLLSFKKLALIFGSAITGIFVLIFIFNLSYTFIDVSLLLRILFFVIATTLNILFAIIIITKEIFHVSYIHTSQCEKGCDLNFNLDCYDYPNGEKPTISTPKRHSEIIRLKL